MKKEEWRVMTKKEQREYDERRSEIDEAEANGFRDGWNAAVDAMNEAMPGLMNLPKRKS